MTTTIKTDFIIFEMLTASTGSHFLDSGGSGGRHWERNQKKSFDEFLKSHEATLEITVNVNNNEPYFDFTANVFHVLKNNLSYIHSEFLSWSGELINIEGMIASDDELQEIAKKMGCGTHEAFI